ncbi:hypothetical protein WN48_02970 [Eufriesea mexicana]|uniref:Uncharacterized protein n=1 Tax=Eufriesea mexicana TaxID=516756 RepID=A0A310SFG2_9HYME|nr:hypothetical protein WN48_02970 [Eufriesea mexicana]
MRTAQVGCNTEFAAGSKADNASSDIDHAVARHTQPTSLDISMVPFREVNQIDPETCKIGKEITRLAGLV